MKNDDVEYCFSWIELFDFIYSPFLTKYFAAVELLTWTVRISLFYIAYYCVYIFYMLYTRLYTTYYIYISMYLFFYLYISSLTNTVPTTS